jgi:hypothetical protein
MDYPQQAGAAFNKNKTFTPNRKQSKESGNLFTDELESGNSY